MKSAKTMLVFPNYTKKYASKIDKDLTHLWGRVTESNTGYNNGRRELALITESASFSKKPHQWMMKTQGAAYVQQMNWYSPTLG